MREEEVTFYSEGVPVQGLLRVPDETPEPVPGIVQGPGFLGLKDSSSYKKYHEKFTAAGYGVLVFDYRGFGDSDGEELLLPERQVEDIRNGLTYLETRSEIDEHRLGLYGSGGTGGGNAVLVAGRDDRVKCMVANNAVSNGGEWLRSTRREYEWLELLDAIAEDRQQRVQTGEDTMVPARGEDGLQIPTPERKQSTYKSDVDSDVPQELPLRCAEAIVEYAPEDVVDRITGSSLFICVEGDDTTPESQTIDLYERAPEPKKLLVLTGTSHYQAYEKYFEDVWPQVVDWYDQHLVHEDIRLKEE